MSKAVMNSFASSGLDGEIAPGAVGPARSFPHSCNEPPLSARLHLKRATDAAHRRLDGGLSRFELSDSDGYRRFLLVHAMALPPMERALAAGGFDRQCAGWTGGQRRRALHDDLAGLGMERVPYDAVPAVRGATAWGVAYVLEGSRLGGKLLARRVAAGGNPRAIGNARFLNSPATVAWPRFVERMEGALSSRDDLTAALAGASMAFATFNAAFEYVAGAENEDTGGDHER